MIRKDIQNYLKKINTFILLSLNKSVRYRHTQFVIWQNGYTWTRNEKSSKFAIKCSYAKVIISFKKRRLIKNDKFEKEILFINLNS